MYKQLLFIKSITRTRILHNSRRSFETHYDVLKLPKNCSSQEIRDAFIKLSKQHHPDINKNQASHNHFQRIHEAYTVLGKPDSRRLYDLGLPTNTSNDTNSKDRNMGHGIDKQNQWNDPSFWVNRDKTNDSQYKNRPYYGIDGVKRLPNIVIVFACLTLVTIGLGLQSLAITRSFTFKREELTRKSNESFETLKETQEIAKSNGNDVQIELLKTRLLANEKFK